MRDTWAPCMQSVNSAGVATEKCRQFLNPYADLNRILSFFRREKVKIQKIDKFCQLAFEKEEGKPLAVSR